MFSLIKVPQQRAYRRPDVEMVFFTPPDEGKARIAVSDDRTKFPGEWWLLDSKYAGSNRSPLALLLLDYQYTDSLDYFDTSGLNSIEYVSQQRTSTEINTFIDAKRKNNEAVHYQPVVHQHSAVHADDIIALCREYLVNRKNNTALVQHLLAQEQQNKAEKARLAYAQHAASPAKKVIDPQNKDTFDPELARINAIGVEVSRTIKKNAPLVVGYGMPKSMQDEMLSTIPADFEADAIGARMNDEAVYAHKHKFIDMIKAKGKVLSVDNDKNTVGIEVYGVKKDFSQLQLPLSAFPNKYQANPEIGCDVIFDRIDGQYAIVRVSDIENNTLNDSYGTGSSLQIFNPLDANEQV